MNRSSSRRFICLLWSLPLLWPPTTAAAERQQPNIVLILADDLGYGDLGCFGQQKLKTPRLDAMAKQGMRFTQFYAGSTVCAPSRSVLMTGKHTGRTVVRGNSTAPIVIRPGRATVASVLKGAGYATACVGKWGIGTPDNFTNPNDVGFDHFFGYVNMWHAHNFYPEFLIRNGKVVRLKNIVAEKWRPFQDPKLPRGGRGVAVKKVEYAPDLFVEDALEFIRKSHKRPFFLYFAMNVPHANNEAGKRGMEVPDLYEFASKDWPEPEKGFAAMIRNIDRDTGRVLDLLEELKIAEDTLVIFTSDNGPHQEGGHRAEFFNSNGELRGIKRDLTEGGIRAPTIAYWPGTIQPGSVDDAHWYFGDVLATAAELARVKPPDDIDSDSFAPTLRGEPRKERWQRRSKMYWEFYERGSAQAVRFGKWKAIRKPMFTGPIELYDMSHDTAEKRNYAERRPDLVRHAGNLLDKMHEPDPNWPGPRKKREPRPRAVHQPRVSVEEKTRVHRLSSTKRAAYDAFVYVNRIPEAPDKGESPSDFAGRIFGRLANQEGRILLKLPPGMDKRAYLGLKTFFRDEGERSVGNCVACHTPVEFTDSKPHVVAKDGSPSATPSLRNLKKRKVDVRKALLKKLAASQQKRSGQADEIDGAYATMNFSKKDVPRLEAFLSALNDVPDTEYRKLILSAKVLDTSEDFEEP